MLSATAFACPHSMKANEMANKSHKDAHAPNPNTPKAQPDTHKVAKTS